MTERLALVAGIVVLALAGCGGDDDDETTTEAPGEAEEAAAVQEEVANLSDKEQVERIGEAWVEPFAAGDEAMCAYLHPDLGAEAEETCATYADGALARSSILQASFAGTSVESVVVKGQTALAKFSNDEPVEFQQDPDGEWWVVDPSADASLRE